MDDAKTAPFRKGINAEKLRAEDRSLWDSLRERLTSERMGDAHRDAALVKWLEDHSPADALAEWAGWQLGDPAWARDFMNNLFTLMDSAIEKERA